ncbi:hypothetical protein QVD17_35610 [Tagetes erecta]|uniref:Translation initiation factor IF-1, chloroplastic n=1 Tax=Tagetes erecta TaxID=13708 RepID=A0AAD8JQT9_TARER|nr:hypothetical protein QVD17_35610 [Tagetes erecta]
MAANITSLFSSSCSISLCPVAVWKKVSSVEVSSVVPIKKVKVKVSLVKVKKSDNQSEQKWVAKGMITESLPNGMFWVRLENGDIVLGYISGKIRRNSIRILPGDNVKIEVSRYDSTRGRIVYRIAN